MKGIRQSVPTWKRLQLCHGGGLKLVASIEFCLKNKVQLEMLIFQNFVHLPLR